MAKIRVKDLEVGMILEADVCDLNGRFLIGKKCELTSKHIKALNAWGVVSVEIDGDNIENLKIENTVSSEDCEQQINILKQNFKHNDLEHPFIAELIPEAARHLVNKKSKT